MSNLNLLQALSKARRTIRTYQNYPLDDAAWTSIKKALVNAPSAFKLKPYYVIVIDAQQSEIIKQVQVTTWNQSGVGEAAKVLILVPYGLETLSDEWLLAQLKALHPNAHDIALKQKLFLIKQHLAKEENSIEDWAAKQCYEAASYALIAATFANVGSALLDAFDNVKLAKFLREQKVIKANETPALMVLLGYPAEKEFDRANTRVRDSVNTKFKAL